MGRNILLYELVASDDLLSAGSCIKQMHKQHIIEDVTLRRDLIDARNALSHVYSGEKSQEIFQFIIQHHTIFQDIQQKFIQLLKDYHGTS
jgi:hypothetical protein